MVETRRGRSFGFGRVRSAAAACAVVVLAAMLGGCGSEDRPAPAADRSGTATTTSTTGPTTSTTAAEVSTTQTTAAPTTTTAVAGPPALTLAFAGDLLPHLPLIRQAAAFGRSSGQAYDFGPMLAPMAPVLGGADVAICHLEVPVAPSPDRIAGYPSFGAPVALVDAVQASGYDGCSTASNHSLDQGRAGIDATLARFDQVGLRHAGTARSGEEADATTIYEVGGAQVAHLSYAYGFNGYRLPADAPFAANLIDVERIGADARRATERGADLVVVSLHWGDEYRHEPSAYQRSVAAQLLPSADIDLVIGHHAHVVQPIEQVEGTYVVWGLGNQLANQATVPRSDGLTVLVRAQQQPDGQYRVGAIEAVPTYVEAGGSYRVWPIARALADPATPAGLRPVLEASYDRTASVIGSRPHESVTVGPRP